METEVGKLNQRIKLTILLRRDRIRTRFNIKRAQVVWMLNDKEASCILLENK